MSISVDSFLKHKGCSNEELKRVFSKRFAYILNKFESLSKSNAYKKLQRANIIKLPKSDNNILNLLNKITDNNYDVISQKILLKLSDANVVVFIEQIFVYIEKFGSNSKSLWELIKLFMDHPCVTDTNRAVIVEMLKRFVDRFLDSFDTAANKDGDSIESEGYSEFVERNKGNVAVISKMHMVYTMLIDDRKSFELSYDINVVVTIMTNKLNLMIHDNNNRQNDNSIYVLMECIFIVIKDPVIKNNPYAHKKFRNLFDNENVRKKMTNKIRFKLMDIIDYIS
jgi:hypothetical protein